MKYLFNSFGNIATGVLGCGFVGFVAYNILKKRLDIDIIQEYLCHQLPYSFTIYICIWISLYFH